MKRNFLTKGLSYIFYQDERVVARRERKHAEFQFSILCAPKSRLGRPEAVMRAIADSVFLAATVPSLHNDINTNAPSRHK